MICLCWMGEFSLQAEQTFRPPVHSVSLLYCYQLLSLRHIHSPFSPLLFSEPTDGLILLLRKIITFSAALPVQTCQLGTSQLLSLEEWEDLQTIAPSYTHPPMFFSFPARIFSVCKKLTVSSFGEAKSCADNLLQAASHQL